jgi:hypothetical protein
LNPLNSTWVNITGIYYFWRGGVNKVKKKDMIRKEKRRNEQ